MPNDGQDRDTILQELLAQLQAVRSTARVRISTDHFSAEWDIPAPNGSTNGSTHDLNELEAALLAAFQDDKEKVTGEKLTGRTIYPYGSQAKSALASMHRAKLLVNHSPGFSRTPAGTAALASYRFSHQEEGTE